MPNELESNQKVLPQRTELLKRAASCSFAGVLLACAFPPYNLPFLLPIGIALLIYAVQNVTIKQALYLGFISGALFFGMTMFWLYGLFGIAAVSLIAIASIFPAIFSISFVWLNRRLPQIPMWLLAPTIWTAIEYFRSELFWLKFGWMGLGYAVVNSWGFGKIASWGGSYADTFIIVLIGTVWSYSLKSISWEFTFAPILVWIFLLIPTVKPIPEKPFTVRLVQAEGDEFALLKLSQGPSVQKIDALVWPEYSVDGSPKKLTKQSELAKSLNFVLVFGAKVEFNPRERDGFYNTAFTYSPSGILLGSHIKNHLVHFINEGKPGTDANVVSTPLGKIGTPICFDLDFPDVARRMASSGAEVFLVPNDDPSEWGKVQRQQHKLTFQMRAIENSRWLARADVAGGTSAVGPNGFETASVKTAELTFLDVKVGRNSNKTIYTLFGWRFGQTCFLAAIVLILCSIFRPKRI